MAQYPIDFLKRDDGQRFFPVTHPSAIYDGDKSLYTILDTRFAMKADRVIRQNDSVIYNNIFTASILMGGGLLTFRASNNFRPIRYIFL